MDLEADLRAVILAELVEHTEYPRQLAALGTQELLSVYGNWANRFPPVQPRTVNPSRELVALVSGAGPVARAADAVLAEIEGGIDLEYRLSKDVDVAWVPPEEPRKKRLRQLDRYLAAWGIHHLHLGSPDLRTGRARSKDLLYVVFADDQAYALAVLPHGEWHRDRLLHIAADNWPDGGPLMTSNWIVGLEREFSETERADLFNANVAVPFTRHGRVYSARDNVSLAGTSLGAQAWANETHFDLEKAVKLLEHEPQLVEVAMRRRFPHLIVGPAVWAIEIRNKAFAVVDRNSGAYMRLDEVATARPDHV